MNSAPDVPQERFTAMTRLDQNRAISQLSAKLNLTAGDISRMSIWGNHSPTMFQIIFMHGPMVRQLRNNWIQNGYKSIS